MTTDSYHEMGEFHDLFMVARWQQLAPALKHVFGHFTAADRVLDLGAGTGLGTRSLAVATTARIIAIEPSLIQRAQLTARVLDDAELCRRVSVLSEPIPGVLHNMPGPIDGFVAAHMLGHLNPGERLQSFALLRQLLSPEGVGLITMPSSDPTTEGTSTTHSEVLTLGELTYTAQYSMLDKDTYRNEYQVRRGDRLLRSVASEARYRHVTQAELCAELASVGFSVQVRTDGLGIVRVT